MDDRKWSKTRYGRDAFGSALWEEEGGVGSRVERQMDKAGNVVMEKAADGTRTRWEWDGLNRVSRVDRAGEDWDEAYAWDGCRKGSLCRVLGGWGRWQYGYGDAHGREVWRELRPSGKEWKARMETAWDRGREQRVRLTCAARGHKVAPSTFIRNAGVG